MNRIRTFSMLLLLAACLSFSRTFDLQREIDRACNGCTVVIPPGVYDIGDVVIRSDTVWQKVVTLQGAGHANLGMADGFGGYQWSNQEYFERYGVFGTVLRGTIRLEKGSYPGGTTPKVYFRDLSIVGYGSGVGISYGDGMAMYSDGAFDSISVANYEVGILLDHSYYISMYDVSMAGVEIGLEILESNVVDVRDLNIVNCQTGIVANGNGNLFSGGSIQACNVGVRLGGLANILEGYYFEQIANSALYVEGRNHVISGIYFSGNSGDPEIDISGHNNSLSPVDVQHPVRMTGNYNRVELSAYGSCDDAGYSNQCTRLFP